MLMIGKVETLTGLPAKTIRYYEEIKLITPPTRSDNGYRYFSQTAIDQLLLIKGARDAGFSLAQCKELMMLFNDKSRQSSEVKAITLEKIKQIKQKIKSLNQIVKSLELLSSQCHGNDSSDCAILDGLLKK